MGVSPDLTVACDQGLPSRHERPGARLPDGGIWPAAPAPHVQQSLLSPVTEEDWQPYLCIRRVVLELRRVARSTGTRGLRRRGCFLRHVARCREILVDLERGKDAHSCATLPTREPHADGTSTWCLRELTASEPGASAGPQPDPWSQAPAAAQGRLARQPQARRSPMTGRGDDVKAWSAPGGRAGT